MSDFISIKDRLPETPFFHKDIENEDKLDYYYSEPVLIYVSDELAEKYGLYNNYALAHLEYFPNSYMDDGLVERVFFGNSVVLEEYPLNEVRAWMPLPKMLS